MGAEQSQGSREGYLQPPRQLGRVQVLGSSASVGPAWLWGGLVVLKVLGSIDFSYVCNKQRTTKRSK